MAVGSEGGSPDIDPPPPSYRPKRRVSGYEGGSFSLANASRIPGKSVREGGWNLAVASVRACVRPQRDTEIGPIDFSENC